MRGGADLLPLSKNCGGLNKVEVKNSTNEVIGDTGNTCEVTPLPEDGADRGACDPPTARVGPSH